MKNIMSTTQLPPATGSLSEARSIALSAIAERFEVAGKYMRRYGLVLILFWIGGMKFTSVEAQAIRPFVENSPFFAWTYPVFGIQGLSDILGAIEIALGLMIAARPWWPRVSAAGSLLAMGMFLSTLSFLVTTPAAWVAEIGGFPAISVPGQFLIKDVALLGIAVWSLGEALRAARPGSVTG
jgi:uncharacterized membrane protein YkgB